MRSKHKLYAADEIVVTVIIPVFNEEQTLDDLLQKVIDAPVPKQLIVVDDGSTDGTRSRLAAWSSNEDVTVIHHDRNLGKGAAIRTALPQAVGEYAIIQDADLEYDPLDYQALLAPVLAGRATVVYGTRLRSSGWRIRKWSAFAFGCYTVNLCVAMLYGRRLSDVSTCYKLIPTDLLKSLGLESDRFEFCAEVTAKLCRLGVDILEVPISYYPRTILEGKKIRLSDGVSVLSTLWRFRNWRPSRTLAVRPTRPNKVASVRRRSRSSA